MQVRAADNGWLRVAGGQQEAQAQHRRRAHLPLGQWGIMQIQQLSQGPNPQQRMVCLTATNVKCIHTSVVTAHLENPLVTSPWCVTCLPSLRQELPAGMCLPPRLWEDLWTAPHASHRATTESYSSESSEGEWLYVKGGFKHLS